MTDDDMRDYARAVLAGPRPWSDLQESCAMLREVFDDEIGDTSDPHLLKGKAIQISGRLESMERGEARVAVEARGGRLSWSGPPARKLNFLVVGARPAKWKIQAALNVGADVLDEDGFIALLLRGSPA